jgi:hypothetical protein
MKKIFQIIGVVVVVVVVLFVGLLFWAHGAGSKKQEAFFTAVLSGDPAEVIEMLHPDARDGVDAPVLAAWMAAIKDNLGELKGLSKSNFSTKVEGATTQSEGTVNFEKGSATSLLVFVDDQIVEFSIESDDLPDDWFQGPADTTLYQQRGEKLLTLLLTGETDQGHAMLHETLQVDYPLEKMEADLAVITPQLGALKEVTYVSDEFRRAGTVQVLTVSFTVTGENGSAGAYVRFQFEGMKGHLIAFRVPA